MGRNRERSDIHGCFASACDQLAIHVAGAGWPITSGTEWHHERCAPLQQIGTRNIRKRRGFVNLRRQRDNIMESRGAYQWLSPSCHTAVLAAYCTACSLGEQPIRVTRSLAQ